MPQILKKWFVLGKSGQKINKTPLVNCLDLSPRNLIRVRMCPEIVSNATYKLENCTWTKRNYK